MSLFRNILINKKRKPYYCEVEHIQSSGTQYIDTGIYGTLNTEVELSVYANPTDTHFALLGDFTDTSKAVTLPFNSSSGTGLYSRFGNKSITTGLGQPAGKHVFKINKTGVYIDGVLKGSFNATTDFTTVSTLYLFKFNGLDRNYLAGKLYYCKIRVNGLLVRDLIPVLDWSYVPCMYDKISGRLFYNQGTGQFTYGREIHYVDYIESSGTQYIDAGFIPNQNTKVELSYQISTDLSTGFPFFGSRVSASSSGYSYQRYSSGVMGGQYGDNIIYSTTPPDLNKHIVVRDKNKIYLDGVDISSQPTATFTCPGNLYINAMNNNGTAATQNCGVKYFHFKYWQNGSFGGDFYPAIDENGVGFLFDKVTHSIFDNAGTGLFKYPARELEYIEATGTQYLNTGWNPGANAGQFTFDVEVKCTSNSNGHGAIGSRSADNSRNWVITNVNNTTSGVLSQYGYGSTYQNVVAGTSGKWGRFRTYIDGSNYVFESTVDGVVSSETTILQTFTNTANVYLMGINNKGSLFASFPFKGQMRRARLYDRGTLVKDYRPAFKNGYFGLWDAVNDYLPGITGTVTHGKILESRWF